MSYFKAEMYRSGTAVSVKYKRLDFRRSVGIRGKALVIVIRDAFKK